MMQSVASFQRVCSGLQASTSAKESGRTSKAAVTVSVARAGPNSAGQEPQLRRRLSQNALAMECEAALSCPWPRTLEPSRVAPQRRGILSGAISALQQVWERDGTLPAEVEVLAGGFTDAENACMVEEPENGLARWWRYQGFRL